MSARLKKALDAREAATRKVSAVLKDEYPEGAPVAWVGTGSDDVRRGVVTMNCYDDRLKVRNARTNCELFIYAYRIVP